MTTSSHIITRVIGIDPGGHGSLAFIDDRGRLVVHKTAGEISMRDCALDALVGVSPEQCIAYIELIGGFVRGNPCPGSTMFKMGKNAGYWEGLFAGLGVRVQLVRPQVWQAGIPGAAGQEKPQRKRAIRDHAQRLYPSVKVTLETADAIMITDFGAKCSLGKAVAA